jgi:hypothetical protein
LEETGREALLHRGQSGVNSELLAADGANQEAEERMGRSRQGVAGVGGGVHAQYSG